MAIFFALDSFIIIAYDIKATKCDPTDSLIIM